MSYGIEFFADKDGMKNYGLDLSEFQIQFASKADNEANREVVDVTAPTELASKFEDF